MTRPPELPPLTPEERERLRIAVLSVAGVAPSDAILRLLAERDALAAALEVSDHALSMALEKVREQGVEKRALAAEVERLRGEADAVDRLNEDWADSMLRAEATGRREAFAEAIDLVASALAKRLSTLQISMELRALAAAKPEDK